MLEAFLAAPQTLLTRNDLLERIWGSHCVAESALTVVVAKLRRTLGRAPDSGDYVENTYGKGYRLRVLVNPVEVATFETSVALVQGASRSTRSITSPA